MAGTVADRLVAPGTSTTRARSLPTGDLRLLAGSVGLALVFVAGILIDNDTVLLVATMAAIGLALAWPWVGLMTLLLVSPVLYLPLLPAPGFLFLLVAATILGSVYRLPLDRPRLVAPPAFLLLLAFMTYVLVQQSPDLLAGYPGELRDVGSIMAKLMVGAGAVVAAASVMSRRSPYAFLGAMILSAAFVGVLSVLQVAMPDVAASINLIAEPEQTTRPGGSIGNPNYAGFFLACGAIVAISWMVITPSFATRLAIVPFALPMLAGLVVALSRGAVVTFIAGLVFAAFARGRRTGMTVAAVAIIAGLVALPLVLEQRHSSFGLAAIDPLQRQAISDAGRLDSILIGPELFQTSPLFGVGLFRYVLEGGRYAHNYYMTVLAEQGLIGITLWLGFLLAAGYLLVRLPRGPRTVGLGVYGAFVIGSMFLEPTWDEQTIVLPAVAITAAIVANWGPTREGDIDERARVRLRPDDASGWRSAPRLARTASGPPASWPPVTSAAASTPDR